MKTSSSKTGADPMRTAPKRPKSAYICFLQEFRCSYSSKEGSKSQRDVCTAAGQAWAGMSAEERAPYVQQSEQSKQTWAEHLKDIKEAQNKNAPPKRPMGPYLFFLDECRARWKSQYPGEKVHQRSLCAAAGRAWAAMGPEERSHYTRLSQASKAAWAKGMQQQGAKRHRRPSLLPLERADSSGCSSSMNGTVDSDPGGLALPAMDSLQSVQSTASPMSLDIPVSAMLDGGSEPGSNATAPSITGEGGSPALGMAAPSWSSWDSCLSHVTWPCPGAEQLACRADIRLSPSLPHHHQQQQQVLHVHHHQQVMVQELHVQQPVQQQQQQAQQQTGQASPFELAGGWCLPLAPAPQPASQPAPAPAPGHSAAPGRPLPWMELAPQKGWEEQMDELLASLESDILANPGPGAGWDDPNAIMAYLS